MKLNNTKFHFFTILIIALFFITNSADSQIKFTSKKFKPSVITVELLFNYSQPLPSMYGQVKDFFDFSTYGVKTGFGGQINVKLAANKKGTIRPYGTIGYSLFLGNDNSTAYIGPNTISTAYPLANNQKFETAPGTSKIYMHIFNAGLGFGYDFVNKTRWTPFLGFEGNLNIIFGTYRQTPNITPPNSPKGEVTFTIKQAARFGFGFNSGITFRVHKLIGFNFNAKYKFANLLGINSHRISEENKMELLDKSDPSIHSSLTKSRTIQYFEFGLGISFHIGRK
ncbi:MAG: hypothetical protein EHM58_07550 [Ignavibacteriae bacterium]|nr:MAG: hypothetical protein EHM58_07550 [Ignavibacteriota bacterium]